MGSQTGKNVAGSKPLENLKHEEIVQAYFALNFNKTRAINSVMGEPDSQSTTGSRIVGIFGREEVKARIKWLYEQKKAKVSGSSKEDLLEMLLRRASASLTDVIKVDYDENGKPEAIIVPSDLLDGQTVDEITIMPTKYGDRIKIKMPDKERAIEIVAKIEKLISNDTKVEGSLALVQDEEANKAYANRMKKIQEEKEAKAAKPDDNTDTDS